MSAIFNRWFILLAIGAGLAAIGCDKKDDANKPAAGAGTSTPAPAPATVPTEPIVIAPQELVKQFMENSAAANAKYPAKTPFKITGVVSSFSPSMSGFKLKSEDKPGQLAVMCYFDDADTDIVKKAAPGQKFTIIGKFSMYNSSDKEVDLNHCKVAQ